MSGRVSVLKVCPAAALILLFVLPIIGYAGAAGCVNCSSLYNLSNAPVMTTVANSGDGVSFTVILADTPPLPSGLSSTVTYTAWCATGRQGPPLGTTETPITVDSTVMLGQDNLAFNEVNWLLNNRPSGVSASDVKAAIWATLGIMPASALSASALAMYNAALGHADYLPPSGGIVGIYLSYQPTMGSAYQNLIMEVPYRCANIGDFVWYDANNNGIQDADEQGIDGISVELQSGNDSISAQTGPAPAGYTPAYAHGYYQFSVCPEGTYTVSVDGSQKSLADHGYAPVTANAGSNPAKDSNAPSYTFTMPSGVLSDETIDFGYYAPLSLNCSGTTATGKVGDSFNSPAISVSGGTSPYTFSMSTGMLPAGLTLNPDGSITGTPLSANSFSIAATDANGQLVPGSCPFTITALSAITRTQGFWSTHTTLANAVWNNRVPDDDKKLCSIAITAVAKPDENQLMGGFLANVSNKTTNPKKRPAIDQARMQMLQQYLAAVLNVYQFGSGTEEKLQTATAAYCADDLGAIQQQIGILDSFNSSGDALPFNPPGSATPKDSKSQADIAFWDLTIH